MPDATDVRHFITQRYAEDQDGERALHRLRQLDKDPTSRRPLDLSEMRALIDRIEAYENDLTSDHTFLRLLSQTGAETAQLAALTAPLRADTPCIVRARKLIDTVSTIMLPLSA